MTDKYEDVTGMDMIVGVIQRAVTYNIIELLFIVGYLNGYSYGGVHPAALWFGFASAVVWIIATSLDHAAVHAKDMVLNNEMFMIDFMSGAVILMMLAFIVRHEDWYFSAMFLLAAAQHLRYTYLSANWLLEKRDGHSDDSM